MKQKLTELEGEKDTSTSISFSVTGKTHKNQ